MEVRGEMSQIHEDGSCWVVAPFSQAEIYRRFVGACCLHHHCPVDEEGNKQRR
jgi:hypothetical protein